MSRIKILIINNSYVLTKGLMSVLNEITETEYSNVDINKEIKQNISEYNPNIIIYNKAVSTEIKEYINTNKYIFIEIGYKEKTKSKYNINIFNDDKSTIISLIRTVISENFKSQVKTKNYSLSPREITIVKLIAQGLTNKEIADKLFLSIHTVITHRKNITNRLNIKTVSGLTVYAILNNIIDIKDVK